MTGSRGDCGPHIDDGDLIRLSDGECSPEEVKRIRTHIDNCSDCKDNSDTLADASGAFSRLLAELEPTAPLEVVRGVDAVQPPAESRSPRFRFASSRVLRVAAVLVAVVLVFSATPARAWLVHGWEALKSLVAADTGEMPAEPIVPEAASPVASSVIRFTPGATAFRLEVVDRPAAGTLAILFDSVTAASASILGGDGTEGMVLLPDGLQIRNSAASFASYEVRLPMSLSIVEVLVAGRAELILDVQSLSVPSRRELNLAGEQGR